MAYTKQHTMSSRLDGALDSPFPDTKVFWIFLGNVIFATSRNEAFHNLRMRFRKSMFQARMPFNGIVKETP